MKGKLPGLSVPAEASPAERKFYQAVIEHLQVASGDRRSALDRSITVRDLVDAGLASAVVKNDRASLRAAATATAAETTPPYTFSVATWNVAQGDLGNGTAVEVLAYDSDARAYLRVPAEYLAPLLGLVNTFSPQEISAAWRFVATADFDGEALRFGGEQVVTTPGHGLQKTGDDFELEVVDADLVIDWTQLDSVPSTFPPSTHTHPDTVISPAQITADTNDYAPTDIATSSIVRVSTDASRNLTGMVPGIRRTIINVGASNLVIKTADAGSAAANRFLLTGDITLVPNESATFFYDVDSRWRRI